MNIFQCPSCKSRYDAHHVKTETKFQCRCGQSFYIPELPKQAKGWNCPNCAGAINPSKAQCEYCGVFLSFARCPGCFSLILHRSGKFCSECGESVLTPAKSSSDVTKKLECPRCKKHDLEGELVNQYLINGCRHCGGMWLDHHVLARILDSVKNRPNVHSFLGTTSVASVDLKYHEITYMKCPECEDLMYRRNFASNSGIIVDECSKHGIWFDKHELSVAIEHMRSTINLHSDILDNQISVHNDNHSENTKKVISISEEDLENLVCEYPELFEK